MIQYRYRTAPMPTDRLFTSSSITQYPMKSIIIALAALLGFASAAASAGGPVPCLIMGHPNYEVEQYPRFTDPITKAGFEWSKMHCQAALSDLNKIPSVLYIPHFLSGVVVAYNVPGWGGANQPALNFTANVLALIYKREIVSWNDTRLLDINPAFAASSTVNRNSPITPVARSDPSSANFDFTVRVQVVASLVSNAHNCIILNFRPFCLSNLKTYYPFA
jgi:hypothetical protein